MYIRVKSDRPQKFQAVFLTEWFIGTISGLLRLLIIAVGLGGASAVLLLNRHRA